MAHIGESLVDTLGRPIRDLRISVTDRCNFRCVYCMPKEVFGKDFPFIPRQELLTFEEITRVASVFATLGVQKLRLTGGEPLIRRGLEALVSQLANIPGIKDIALTTNGSLLTLARARALKDAGLRRITISLDSINDAVFQKANDVNFSVARVLSAIEAADQAGLAPIKINMVVKRGLNDGEIEAMSAHFRGTPHIIRFIEYMDVGTANGWKLDEVVTSQEIFERIHGQWPLTTLQPTQPGEVARRYQYQDGSGEIGIIASVTQPFCHQCSRARLSPEGHLYTCLFGAAGTDLRPIIRAQNYSDSALANHLRSIWLKRDDQYSVIRSASTHDLPKVEMFRIGG